jgi:hypothetical protein
MRISTEQEMTPSPLQIGASVILLSDALGAAGMNRSVLATASGWAAAGDIVSLRFSATVLC